MAQPERILVTRNDKLGDVVLATPVFLSLRRSFPQAHIAALVSPAGYEAVRDNPHLSEVVVDDERGENRGWPGFLKLVERVKQKRFDTALILFSDWRMGCLSLMAGIPRRIGPASKPAQIFYTKRIRQHRSRSIRHEAEYNLELAQVLGAEPVLKTEVWTSAGVKEEAERFFEKLGLDPQQPLIGIHPGSGGSSRNWSIEHFAKLANSVVDKLGASIFITHGPGEEQLVERLVSSLRVPPYRYPGNYGIQLLAEIIKRFKVFVSSNTGPMHLAAAVGTPSVSLFSPLIVCRPRRWGPIGNKHIVLIPELPECRRCRPDKCNHPDCQDLISAEQVFEAVIKLL
jgi:ADP-heptose:LPS heptosyltransferase